MYPTGDNLGTHSSHVAKNIACDKWGETRKTAPDCFPSPSPSVYLQCWPDIKGAQEVIERSWFAPANVKYPDPDLLLPWDLEAPFFRLRDAEFPWNGSRRFVLHLHPYVRLELKLRQGRTFWIWGIFYCLKKKEKPGKYS